MITSEEFVLELNNINSDKSNFKLGTVIDLFDNQTAQVQFDGEDTPSEKQYAYLESYPPTVFDRVLLAVIGGTYIIMGKVNYNISPPTKEELDRYLFDIKLVTMTKGLNVTGATTLNSGATVTGNIGVSGNISAVGISATGNIVVSGSLQGASISTSGTLEAGATTVSSLTVDGDCVCDGNQEINGVLYADNSFLHRGSALSFYNKGSAAAKQNVYKHATTPTVDNLKTKLNELIGALQFYNLIGGN